MKILFILSLLLCYTSVHAQTRHHIQSGIVGEHTVPYGKDSALTTVYITNKYNYHMMVYNLKTLDWRYTNQKYSSVQPVEKDIVMRDATNGISVQDGNYIQYTKDGWKTATTDTNMLDVLQVALTDSGYVANRSKFVNSSTLYFSADGSTWSQSSNSYASNYKMQAYGNKVVATDGTSGWLISYDGGQSFKHVYKNDHPYTRVKKFWLVDTAVYYVTDSYDNLWRSINSGQSWSSVKLPVSGDIVFKNANVGMLLPFYNDSMFYVTVDSGKTWQSSGKQLPSAFYKGSYVNDYFYFNRSYRTPDEGRTFEEPFPQLTYADPHDIHFNKNGVGLISGYKLSLSKNNGVTFQPLDQNPSEEGIMAVHVLNDNILLAGDKKGQIFVSKDMGESWIQKNTENSNLNAIRFDVSADEKTILLRRAGQSMISTNGGETFSLYVIDGSNYDHAVSPDGTIYYASNQNNIVKDSLEIHTVDTVSEAKTSILRIYSPKTVLSRIHMTSNFTGYVISYNQESNKVYLYRTDDAWKSSKAAGTITAQQGSYSGLVSIFNFGNDTLVMVPHSGKFYHYTTNGGQSWHADTVRLFGQKIYYNLKGSHFFSLGHFMLGLEDRTILIDFNHEVQANDTTSISVSEKSKRFRNLILYPNPAGNVLYIQFDNVLNSKILQAKVYDLSGRLISGQNLNNSNLVNISQLDRGMYILHIYSNEKMLGTARFIKQ